MTKQTPIGPRGKTITTEEFEQGAGGKIELVGGYVRIGGGAKAARVKLLRLLMVNVGLVETLKLVPLETWLKVQAGSRGGRPG
jgi:hypothetical protein